mgnify:CR=1 FL=1
MVYRFKVWFEENEDIYRIYDLNPNNSFYDFFKIIIESLSFNLKLDSSFYISDDNWRKGKEINLLNKDNRKLLMSETKLKDHINDPHQKMILITDFNEQWTLMVELQSIQNEIKGINYPLVFKTVGKAPKQNEGTNRFKVVDENEFDEIANKLVANQNVVEDEGFDEEGFGEEGEESESEDFENDFDLGSEDLLDDK